MYTFRRLAAVLFVVINQTPKDNMAPPPSKVEEAKSLSTSDPKKAEEIYKQVLAKSPGSNQAALQEYENALVGLGELYRDQKRTDDLAELIKTSRSTLSSFAKAKTAKLGMLFPRIPD